MSFESLTNPESDSRVKGMNLSLPNSGIYDTSKLYEIPSIAVGLEDIVLLEHRDPTKLSIAERGVYIRKIYDAFGAIEPESGAVDDRTYVMARWLQEALLVPKRVSPAVTTQEVREILISQNLSLGEVIKIIETGLENRAGRAAIEDDDVEIIRIGIGPK